MAIQTSRRRRRARSRDRYRPSSHRVTVSSGPSRRFSCAPGGGGRTTGRATPCLSVCRVPGSASGHHRLAVGQVLALDRDRSTTPDATRWEPQNYFYQDLRGLPDQPYYIRSPRPAATVSVRRAITIASPSLLEEDRQARPRASPDGRRQLIDFNRSGPLMEIVTDRTSERRASARYAEELQLLLLTIVPRCRMDRAMRVEANVSIRRRGATEYGTRIEVKNMNSFRSVERAIAFEVDRQAAALDAGEPLMQETRGWSDDRGATYHMRSKETSDDYRYFPEPDLPPLHVDRTWLERLAAAMPELPAARRERFTSTFSLSAYDAAVLVADRDAATLFEAVRACDASIAAKSIANWVTGDYLRLRNAGYRRPLVSSRPSSRRPSASSMVARSRARRQRGVRRARHDGDRGIHRDEPLQQTRSRCRRGCRRRRHHGNRPRSPTTARKTRTSASCGSHEGDPRPAERRSPDPDTRTLARDSIVLWLAASPSLRSATSEPEAREALPRFASRGECRSYEACWVCERTTRGRRALRWDGHGAPAGAGAASSRGRRRADRDGLPGP